MRRIVDNKPLFIGLLFFLILLIMIVLGPYLPFIDSELTKHGFLKTENKIIPPPYDPSGQFLLGSDRSGRDLLSVLVLGSKETFFTVLVISVLCFIISVPFGLLAAFNRFGQMALHNWNILFSRIPSLFFILLMANNPLIIFSNKRWIWLIVIIIVLEVGRLAEILRQQLNDLKTSEFILSGLAVGNKPLYMFRHYYLPYIFPQLSAVFVMLLGKIMFLIGQLGIFSIFISQKFVMVGGIIGGPPIYEMQNASLAWPTLLGNILYDIQKNPWIPFSTALFITFFIMTFNLLGQGIRNQIQKQYRVKHNL
ncbi:ABC transporter permease subunit [Bacillus sp. CGMCC 1.16607]|uniref:ABC transporter permease subunit n=1 Tax=Bacillus sp. CGMCC 1.16607 TaxID=3351842 RepID=UPI003632A917